jgi:hypothetical protein
VISRCPARNSALIRIIGSYPRPAARCHRVAGSIILVGGCESRAGIVSPESKMRIDPKPNPRKGLLAGAVGGLIACFAMSQFHSAFQNLESSDQDKQEDSTVKTASAVSQRIFHHELTPQQKKIAGPAVHYGFGASIATFYGAAVEILPADRMGHAIRRGGLAGRAGIGVISFRASMNARRCKRRTSMRWPPSSRCSRSIGAQRDVASTPSLKNRPMRGPVTIRPHIQIP